MNYILQGLTALIVFIGISSPIIVVGVIYYLKKRLEHKQIMTAIEKGTPLSEIIPPKPRPAGPAWIKYVSTGIALLIIGLGFVLGGLGRREDIGILIFFVLGGIGVAMLIRGLLHRKYYLKNELSAENNSTEEKKSA
ncbi:MAG TPA: DUF6249 domain-containing protein [Sedimentisphaerales bacterium]|nr:DUF6249 domain-containing protein [Sedimentisphaerales bacterium]